MEITAIKKTTKKKQKELQVLIDRKHNAITGKANTLCWHSERERERDSRLIRVKYLSWLHPSGGFCWILKTI